MAPQFSLGEMVALILRIHRCLDRQLTLVRALSTFSGLVSTSVTPSQFSRMDLSSTVLGDGNVLIVGGDVAAVFDPSTNVFTKVGDPLVPRKGHSAVLLANSTVLVAGGSSLGRFATSAEVYDPSVRQFRTAAPLSAPAPRPSLVAAGDGALLVTGDRIERYSPGNDTFTLVDVTLPASGPTVVRISEGLVLLTGGLSSEVLDRSGTVRASDLVALLDLTTGSIRTLGKMTTPRFLHTATLLEDGLCSSLGATATRTGMRP
ncbi:MAG: hypothetical protein IPI85_14055 [Dehalococcoidia bacterium]|nr:hypothetical protein [Dehalococcoidia bacterium]